MRKFGFTMAEILITMATIGIVASLTLPLLTNDIQKKQIDARIKNVESAISNAFSLMLLQEETESLAETEWYTASSANRTTELSKYMKLSGTSNQSAHFADSIGKGCDSTVQLKNGAIICFNNLTSAGTIGTNENLSLNRVANIYVDVNGSATRTGRPNIAGTDIFGFVLTENATIYPCGSTDILGRLSPADNSACTVARGNLQDTISHFE